MSLDISLTQRGLRQMLNSSEVVDELERRAILIAAAADGLAGSPGGHKVSKVTRVLPAERGQRRARVAVLVVSTESELARLRSAQFHTLLRSMDAGRG